MPTSSVFGLLPGMTARHFDRATRVLRFRAFSPAAPRDNTGWSKPSTGVDHNHPTNHSCYWQRDRGVPILNHFPSQHPNSGESTDMSCYNGQSRDWRPIMGHWSTTQQDGPRDRGPAMRVLFDSSTATSYPWRSSAIKGIPSHISFNMAVRLAEPGPSRRMRETMC